jgi:hypothetical protein
MPSCRVLVILNRTSDLPRRKDSALHRIVISIQKLVESSSFWFATYLLFFPTVSYILGGDGTPDFKIYHYYNGYAAISGGRPQDIAAAQLQTYYFPSADALYFCLIQWLNDWPGVTKVIFALPNVLAAYCAFQIAERITPADWPLRKALSGLVALYGCTGAAAVPTIGTSMSDLVAGVFVLVAVLICIVRDKFTPYVTICLAAMSCGAAVGLKLTCLPMFFGMLGGISASYFRQPRIAIRYCAIFGAVGAGTCLLMAGWWWLQIYTKFGNPIFPSLNNIFKSDMIDVGSWTDDRFNPTGWLMSLFYPVYWAFKPTTRVIELNMRDSRILISLTASLIILGIGVFGQWRWSRQRTHPSDKANPMFMAVFFLVSYFLWEVLFSIYRYLVVLESLSGVMALSAMAFAVRPKFRSIASLVLAVILTLSASTTIYPWWSRSTPAKHIVEATVPSVSPDSMILMLDPYAMSYLVPFFPPSVRVVGANTNLIHPGSVGRLEKQIEAAINGHIGPLWGLENPKDLPERADATLEYYRLKRADGCTAIKTNIDPPITIACRLIRQALPN